MHVQGLFLWYHVTNLTQKMNKMKELQPIVKQLMEESQQASQARMAEDFALLKQVLEIYDQKTVAECLRSVSGND